MAENEAEHEAPEYRPDGFALLEPLAAWWGFLPIEERRKLDPTGFLTTLFHNRRQLLTHAHRVEVGLFTRLPEAALRKAFKDGKLGWLIQNMDQRLGRMVDHGEDANPVTTALANAIRIARDFGLRNGYEPEHIGTLFGLERFEQSKRAAADEPRA